MIYRKRQGRTTGFTLLELLLYIAIVSIMLGGLAILFGVVGDNRLKNQSITEVDQQGEAAMAYLARTIRHASNITAPAVASSGSTLTLDVPEPTLTPTTFNLSGTVLQITEGGSLPVSLTNALVEVSDITFRNLSAPGTPGVVQIEFTLTRHNTTGRQALDYQKTFITTAALR